MKSCVSAIIISVAAGRQELSRDAGGFTNTEKQNRNHRAWG